MKEIRSHYLGWLVGFLIALTQPSPIAMAQAPANWKPQTLSDAEEKKWIEAVKSHKTADGASVIQVLRYAEKLRPNEFKIEAFDVGYSGSDGKPDGVRIGYWIGQKRLPGDEFADLWFDIQRNDAGITVIARKNKWTNGTIVDAMEGGRDSFLSYIDKMYQETCVAPDTKNRTC